MTDSGSKIIVALDYPNADQAMAFVNRVSPAQCRLKVGKELFTRSGPGLVEKLVTAGYDVFLDLKFHDIPNTVAQACIAAADLGVWMMNVHALGGRRMMTAAKEALEKQGHHPLLIAVTILTSMEQQDLAEVGLAGEPQQNVLRLAHLAKDSGLDGVVCSPMEVKALRQAAGAGFRLVTPGVRPQGADKSDQRRTMTPSEAVSQGADYLVIGRPITQSDDPVQALKNIASEIDTV